jgi:hypothetical protein
MGETAVPEASDGGRDVKLTVNFHLAGDERDLPPTVRFALQQLATEIERQDGTPSSDGPADPLNVLPPPTPNPIIWPPDGRPHKPICPAQDAGWTVIYNGHSNP